jgi:hypothetical protein
MATKKSIAGRSWIGAVVPCHASLQPVVRLDGLRERQTLGEGRSTHDWLAKRRRGTAFEHGMAKPSRIVIRWVESEVGGRYRQPQQLMLDVRRTARDVEKR